MGHFVKFFLDRTSPFSLQSELLELLFVHSKSLSHKILTVELEDGP